MAVVQTEAVLSLAPVASIQSLGDGAVVLLADNGQLYTCNDTAETLLNLVDGQRTLADIVDIAADEYDASRSVIETDFLAMASELVEEGILKL